MQPIDAVFSALSDPNRRAILHTLAREGGVSASALARQLPITRQGVSKHLDVLYGAGLVYRQRQGREVRYQPDLAQLAEAREWLAGIAAEWDNRLAELVRIATEPWPDETEEMDACRAEMRRAKEGDARGDRCETCRRHHRRI